MPEEPKVMRSNILEACKDMLRWQVYVIYTTPTNGLGPVMENIEPHLEYQFRMEKEGVYIAVGPHWEDEEDTWHGEGRIGLRARNLAEARRVAASDAWHNSDAP